MAIRDPRRGDDLPDAVGYLPMWVQPLMWTDCAQWIERMSAWEVDPRIVVDRRRVQTSSAKFLLPCANGTTAEASRSRDHHLNVHVPTLADLVEGSFGARRYLSDLVEREAETSDAHGPSSSYTGGYLESSTLMAINELWFDNIEWGSDALRSTEAVALLRDSVLGRVEGYSVDEILGVDKVEPLRRDSE